MRAKYCGLLGGVALALMMAGLIGVTWSGCSKSGSGPGGELHVVSFSPELPVLDSREPVQVKFDKPIVGDDQVGKRLSGSPVGFAPPVAVEARWLDRYTLLVTPTEDYAPSTRYEVTLGESLRQRVPEEERTHAFVHDPLSLKGIEGIDPVAAPKDPRFSLVFSHAVNPEEVAKSCHLLRVKNSSQMPLILQSDPKKDVRIAVAPKHPLMQGEAYLVQCRALRAAAGNWALENGQAEFSTFAAFEVKKALPTEEKVVPEADRIQIHFTTPVERAAFEKGVVIKLNGMPLSTSHFEQSDDGRVYRWNSFLEAVSRYEIRIKKGLTDRFGQKLESGKVIRFETLDAPPGISAETGVQTVESKMGSYQVWTRNVSAMEVACARIPHKRIAALLGSGDLPLYSWINNNEQDVDWQKLKLKPGRQVLQIDGVKNRWKEHRLVLSEMCGNGDASGIYLAQLSADEVRAQKISDGWGMYPYRVLANVTDLGVVLKAGPASGMVWVTSMSEGNPVSGAGVTVYSVEGKRLFRGMTDGKGMLRLPGSSELNKKAKGGGGSNGNGDDEYEDYYVTQRFIAVVEKGNDVALVDGDWNDGITLWNFSVTADRSGGETKIRGFIQSDRGIYRPGETVHFRALVREVSLTALPRVPRERARIEIDDSYGASIFQKNTALSRFGSVDFDLKLSSQARLGDYYVRITVAGQTFRERFSVEEFRPVSFEVKKTFKKAEQLVGQPLRYSFVADYLFGQPVKDASVSWTVNRCSRPLMFPAYRGYSFANQSSWYWDWYHDEYYDGDMNCEFVADNSTTTDSKGKFSFTVRDGEREDATLVDYVARVTVEDETNQTVSKQVAIRAHATDRYLGMKAASWIQELEKPVSVDAVALQTDGSPVAAEATLTVEREHWECSDTPTRRNRCERRTDKVLKKNVTIESGGSRIDFAVKKAGDYRVVLRGKDSRGKKVESATWVWVTGKNASSWWGDDATRMMLIPSREKYAPGEKAVLIPKGNTEGATLLVTVERGGIMDSFIVAGKPAGEGIEIPVLETYAPNVYVSVAAVKPRTGGGDGARPTFAMGVVNLEVSTEQHALKVEVTTDRPEYQPGDAVQGRIRLTTADGRPVVGEVAVSAADEGVLQLINYQTPNPMNTMYSPFGLGVDTSANILKLARFLSPVDETEEGADGGGDAGPEVRSKFVASAYWKPNLVTDANGEAAFEFTAPDNLTAFRVMAVAADDGARFGAADRRIVVNKKLLLQPVLPRFFGSDDTVTIGAVVHNYSDGSGKVRVNWKLKGLEVAREGRTGETVRLARGESKRVFVEVKVGRDREAVVKMSARMNTDAGDVTDAFRLTLPIRRNLAVARNSLFEGKTDDTGDVSVLWPVDTVPEYSGVSISVDRYGMGMLGESLRYLVQYPYGCLEQTMSKLVPMFKAKDLAASMQLDELKGGKLKQFIDFGVDKVLRHQHDDGQFSLWPDSTPSPHLTAYALWGLSEAEKAGIPVNRRALTKGVAALRRWLSSAGEAKTPGEAAEQAQAAFVLAYFGEGDSGLNARLFENRNMMPVYGRIWLLRAMVAAKDGAEVQKQLAGELLAAAEETDDEAFIQESNNGGAYMSSSVRTTAMAITALSEYDAKLPVIEKLVAGLKAHREDGIRWRNTQENAYALIAISDFVRSRADGTAKVTVSLDGESWQTVEVNGSRVVRFDVPFGQLKVGKVQVASSAPMNVIINREVASEKGTPRAIESGFTVKRTFVNLESGEEVTEVKVGTVVKVRLEVSAGGAKDYVAVSDPLPAGFEALNTRLAVVDSSLSGQTRDSYVWDYVELRDDRVNAFADLMDGGRKEIEYLMRATIPGTFRVPGALAEEMYVPSQYGLSAGGELTVTR